MSLEMNTSKGEVKITNLPGGNRRIEIIPAEGIFVPIKSCETGYPISLIETILSIKDADYVCDEICRETDPGYVEADIKGDLDAYFSPGAFDGLRILDFGCGSGASTMILSRMFPMSEIVGVELDDELIKIARERLAFYDYKNVSLYSSPSGNELPPDIGKFDAVIMSAVFEHLLPNERRVVMPLVWNAISPGGYLFINMTPHRWFPIEHHTTGLPLLNFLPDSIALPFARTFSNRIDPSESWEILLRRGIRGATENGILRILTESSDEKPILLQPNQKGLRDRIDLWYSALNQTRHAFLKKSIKVLLKVLKLATGITLVPNLSLVFQKCMTGAHFR